MAQQVKKGDMTLGEWAKKTIGTDKQATDFVNKLGSNNLLSALALPYKAKQLVGIFGAHPCVAPLCQALKPFWDEEPKQAMTNGTT